MARINLTGDGAAGSRPDLRAMIRHPAARFAIVTLVPVPLLMLGSVIGGVVLVAGLLWVGVLCFIADEIARQLGMAVGEVEESGWADRLSVTIAAAHFLLVPFALWGLSGLAGLSFWGWLACFFGCGLWFGQVSNANAHELIHRRNPRLHGLGVAVYVSLLFGHHASAHRHIHHRFVATPDDPNTAELGEGFYAFAARAWTGSFRAGLDIEREIARRRGRLNPYLVYLGGAVAMLVAVAVLFGPLGLLAWLLLSAYAQVQLLLSDYVQHYGLQRERLAGGRYAPVGPQHSWDAPLPMSRLLMLNAPRHADHHAHPHRPYPDLRHPAGVPMLPHSLPAMATLALVPPLWRQVMDPRVARLQARRAGGLQKAPLASS